jgi:hypothetical protein
MRCIFGGRVHSIVERNSSRHEVGNDDTTCYCTVPCGVPLMSDLLVGQQRSESTEVLHRSKSLGMLMWDC